MQDSSCLKIGTRNSALALVQTDLVIKSLNLKQNYKIVEIISSGDKSTQALRDIGGKSLFAKELHQALINKEIDFAIHCVKDLECSLPEELEITSFLNREDPRDVLIINKQSQNKDLLNVGTCSLRRKNQLEFFYQNQEKQFNIVNCRGNVLKRIEKLKNNQFDAIILAMAGLKRLDIFNNDPELIYKVLPTHPYVPSAGQGALAIVKRKDFNDLNTVFAKANNNNTKIACEIEHLFLRIMQFNCHDPVGTYCQIFENNQTFTLNVMIFDHNKSPLSLSFTQKIQNAEKEIKIFTQNVKKACEFRKSL